MNRFVTGFAVLVMAGLVWLALYVWFGSRPPDWGSPTPLAVDAPLADAVCGIRGELAALEAPLVRRHRFHERWTEHRFAAGSFSYGPFHEIEPEAHVRAFLRRHTNAELIAALAPLLADETLGGRAAVVLASLPVPARSSLSRTSHLAGLVKEAQGGRADAPVRWDPVRGRELSGGLLSSYGLTNIGRRVEGRTSVPGPDTFEGRLEAILEDAARLPLRFVAERPEPRARYESAEEMIAAEPVPAPDEVFTEFLARHAPEDLLVALFPMHRAHGNVGGGQRAMLIWGTGREADFWPLEAVASFRREDLDARLRDALIEQSLDLCDGTTAAGRPAP